MAAKSKDKEAPEAPQAPEDAQPVEATQGADAPAEAVVSATASLTQDIQGNIIILPVKSREGDLQLVRAFRVDPYAQAIVVGGVQYEVDNLQYNPHTLRTEQYLKPAAVLDAEGLQQLIDAGWQKA